MTDGLIAALVSGAINLALLAYYFGRLSARVDVLWQAVFNHLGQDPKAVQRELAAKRK